MLEFALYGVGIAGFMYAVPREVSAARAAGSASAAEMAKITASAGFKARHIAPAVMCTSDLCSAAAERLLAGLGWKRSSIDLLVFVGGTHHYVPPATACSLHGRLGKSCVAFDINLRCSVYVYGLSVVAAHFQSVAAARAFVLVGGTMSKVTSAERRSGAHLFGAAGWATYLGRADSAGPMHCVAGTDGRGTEHLKIPAGMFRVPLSEATVRVTAREGAMAEMTSSFS